MTDTNISPLDQARILSEALPHMQEYDEETIVIKYGGHAMGAEDLAKTFARDIVLLEQTAINPVVVHGGGPQIATMLKRLGIQSEFAAGLRITDVKTILTQPSSSRLVIVKVLTNEAGLFGLGCATFTQRARVVEVRHLDVEAEAAIARA